MRISDLIPDKEILLTRDYWKGRNALAGSSEASHIIDPDSSDQNASSSNGNMPATADPQPLNQAVTSLGTGQQRAPFQEERRDTQGDTSLGAATGLDNLPPVRTFNPRNTVQPSVPEIDWEYAVIERTDPATLMTRTVPFNLGKVVLLHDSSQDLELYPGDVVTIFSNADFAVPRSQQTVQVRMEGEIAMAGTYTALRGETLREIVARAGGFTKTPIFMALNSPGNPRAGNNRSVMTTFLTNSNGK